MPTSEAPVFHEPQQARSRRTLDRLVEATRELVAERGADATSVQDIVARADSSVGSFYARFGGKEDLLDFVEARVWDEARERWEQALAERAWGTLALDELAAGVVRILLDVGRYQVDVRRALQARRTAGGETEPARRFQAELTRGLRGLLLAHADRMGAADAERAVLIGLRVVVGGLREIETAGDLGDEEVVAEVSRLLLAYLGASASEDGRKPPDESTAGLDFFDVWG